MVRAIESLVPLWYRTAQALELPARDATPLPDLHVDAIVVGAGIVGLSTALHLAESGVHVVLLERDAPGSGSSGAANGQVLAGLQKDPEEIIAAYGRECGDQVIAFSGAAPARLFELIARHGIECGLERRGWIQAARSRRGVAQLARRAREWTERGVAATWLDRVATHRLLGTGRYRAAWLDPRAGVVQPLAWVRGLAAAAARNGAELRFGIRVRALRREGGRWCVETNHGVATAPVVVLATNVRTGDVEGDGLDAAARSFVPAYSVQIATDPLPAEVRESLLPERHCASDASHMHLRYFRYDADGRFVMGGPGWLRAPRDGDAGVFRRLERSTRAMFPQLARIPFVHRWAARDAFTADLLPHLFEPAPGVFTALGCNGRGIAIGTALGALLARRAAGEPASALPFPTSDIGAVPMGLGSAARMQLRIAMERLRRRMRA